MDLKRKVWDIFFQIRRKIDVLIFLWIRRGYNIIMTTSLSSDVPVGYFSWAEYDIMAPVQPKTEKALAAAFISNCGARNFRLQALEGLEKAKITIDSYGGCHRNRDGRGELSFLWYLYFYVFHEAYAQLSCLIFQFESHFMTSIWDFLCLQHIFLGVLNSLPNHLLLKLITTGEWLLFLMSLFWTHQLPIVASLNMTYQFLSKEKTDAWTSAYDVVVSAHICIV